VRCTWTPAARRRRPRCWLGWAQDLRAAGRPVIERDGARIDLVSGDAGGTSGPALNYWPITGTLITLEPGRSLEHQLPGPDRAFFYVVSGEVTAAGHAVQAGQIAWSDPMPQATASLITLTADHGDQPSLVMVYSGQPIGQPVAMGGPFVMNNRPRSLRRSTTSTPASSGTSPSKPA